MANPFPFTAGQVLTAAEMNGIGESVAFTPTFNNVTVGNGTIVAFYVLVNKLCLVQVRFTLGSTSSITGSISFNLPFSSAVTNIYGPNAVISDASPATNYVGFTFIGSATALTLSIPNVAATYPTRTSTSATVPITWTTSDSFTMSIVYEVA
jgi:hypothetical protein